MNKPEFEELVNLYFDREISEEELYCLKKELKENPHRRHELRLHHRLHKATCDVLAPKVDGKSRSSNPASTVEQFETRKAMVFRFGMAACALFALVISLSVVLRQPSNNSEIAFDQEFGEAENMFYLEEPMPSFLSRDGLSPQVNLAGLFPEPLSLEQQFDSVDVVGLLETEPRSYNAIDQFDRYQAYPIMSRQPLIGSFGNASAVPSSANDWPIGFKSSLAGFK